MTYKEKQVQYLMTHYPQEFFAPDIRVIGSEVKIPVPDNKHKGSIDILCRGTQGFIICEIKIGPFDQQAAAQLLRYEKGVEILWGKVERLIGISLHSFTMDDDRIEQLLLNRDQLDRVVTKYDVDLEAVLPDPEQQATDLLGCLLQNSTVKQLNALFGRMTRTQNFEFVSQKPNIVQRTAAPLRVSHPLTNCRIQKRGIDIMADFGGQQVAFECKVAADLGKDQLQKYRQHLPENCALVLVSHRLRQYDQDLFETQTGHLVWDDIYDVVAKDNSYASSIKNGLRRLRYHYYQRLTDRLFDEVLERLSSRNYGLYERDLPPSSDKEYYFRKFTVNGTPTVLKGHLSFIIGIQAGRADRLVIRVLNPDDHMAKDRYMAAFVRQFMLEEHFYMGGIELQMHPLFSKDLSVYINETDIMVSDYDYMADWVEKAIDRYLNIAQTAVNAK